MKIESLKLKNFKVFKDVVIKDLPGMSVFMGTNGSGKTTLFDVFGFLSDALHNNVNIAVNRRGGA
ncbi:MAG: AAA family ATPase, partial [Longimonas sp.]|uniref:AAA family ATPase n=1 Tax=Longimonas sp. TaxID=2039626 RepID=UPI003975652B